MFFGGIYTVYGIRSLFRGHSLGGATVLLCQICYVVRRAAGLEVGDKVVVRLVGV